MSHWQDMNLQDKVLKILKNVKPYDQHHHLNMPFLSPYQIAIKFAEQYPKECEALDKPIGGKGSKSYNSIAQYIAGQLSRVVKDALESGAKIEIEGAFLLRDNLDELIYKYIGGEIRSSLGTTWDMSIFRYNPNC